MPAAAASAVTVLERPKSLREMAAERIRQAIIDADFTFGELLSENALAEQFQISKTPIHEALMQLSAEGLVEILPQRGARVFMPTRGTVRDLCDYRLLLEVRAMQLAYARNRAALIAGLEAIFHDMTRAWKARDAREYLRLDTAYHDLFYALCESPNLVAGYRLIAARAAAVRTQIVAPKPESRQIAYREHRMIPGHLRQDQVAEATRILKAHVSRLTDMFLDGNEASR